MVEVTRLSGQALKLSEALGKIGSSIFAWVTQIDSKVIIVGNLAPCCDV